MKLMVENHINPVSPFIFLFLYLLLYNNSLYINQYYSFLQSADVFCERYAFFSPSIQFFSFVSRVLSAHKSFSPSTEKISGVPSLFPYFSCQLQEVKGNIFTSNEASSPISIIVPPLCVKRFFMPL